MEAKKYQLIHLDKNGYIVGEMIGKEIKPKLDEDIADAVRKVVIDDVDYWRERRHYRILVVGYKTLPKITNSNSEIYKMWQEAKWREEAINKYGNGLHLWAKQRDGYVAAKKDSFSLEDMIEFGEYFANTYLGGGNFDKWQSQRLIPAPCDCEIKINGENVTVTKILL